MYLYPRPSTQAVLIQFCLIRKRKKGGRKARKDGEAQHITVLSLVSRRRSVCWREGVL
jgi:hypothetical protein